MKKWLHKIEVFVDKIIPLLLLLLLIIIILELGFHDFVVEHHLEHPIEILDYFIILTFVVDLAFKYNRVRHVPRFIRMYWLDLLAVFPFFLIFRAFEGVLGIFGRTLGEWGSQAQAVLHEGLHAEKEGVKVVELAEKEGAKIVEVVQKEGAKIAQETEKFAKEASKLSRLNRSSRFARILRPLLRIPRFFKSIPQMLHFYEKPTGHHYPHDKHNKLKKK